MSANNTAITCWVLCLALNGTGAFASPVTDIVAAPSAASVGKSSPPATVSTKAAQPDSAVQKRDAQRTLTLEKLEAIQAETVLFEAQLAREKVFRELQKSSNRPDQQQASLPPQVVEITASGRDFTAVLLLGNGNLITVRQEDRIPGTDDVVKRITLNEVVVSGHDQMPFSLSFAG